MDDSSRQIDYQAAAERLLVALSSIARKFPASPRPIPAVKLAALTFDLELRRHWQRETTRRRIRDTVKVARELVRQQHLSPAFSCLSPQRLALNLSVSVPLCLSASGAGYWLTGDRQVIAWYASQRRHHGLTHLAAANQTKRALSAQPALFPNDAAVPAAGGAP